MRRGRRRGRRLRHAVQKPRGNERLGDRAHRGEGRGREHVRVAPAHLGEQPRGLARGELVRAGAHEARVAQQPRETLRVEPAAWALEARGERVVLREAAQRHQAVLHAEREARRRALCVRSGARRGDPRPLVH